jgi:hypothetical protein
LLKARMVLEALAGQIGGNLSMGRMPPCKSSYQTAWLRVVSPVPASGRMVLVPSVRQRFWVKFFALSSRIGYMNAEMHSDLRLVLRRREESNDARWTESK